MPAMRGASAGASGSAGTLRRSIRPVLVQTLAQPPAPGEVRAPAIAGPQAEASKAHSSARLVNQARVWGRLKDRMERGF